MKSRTIFIAPMLLSLFLGLSLSSQANFAATPKEKPAQSAEDALKVQSLMIEGQSNYTHGRYRDAVRAFEQAKALGTSSDYQKANLALGLAEAYRSSGKYKEAEELFKTAIAEAQQDDKKHLNKKYKAGRQRSSDLVPTMMSDLSALYLDQSRFPECEQIVKESIEMGTKKVGANNINLALPLNGLTRLYLKWGKLNEAKNVSDRTLLLFKTPASKNNMLYAYTAFNLAQITNATGKYKQAEQLYNATLMGMESLIGFDHEYCATVLGGCLYFS